MSLMRVMIVAAEDQQLAQSLCAGMAGLPGEGMFIVGLSPDGKLPATHYISSGMIDDQFGDVLGDTDKTFEAAGGQVPLAAIDGMYTRSTIIADGDPFQVMADLSLQLVTQEVV